MRIIFTSDNKIYSSSENGALTEIPCGRIIKYRETVRSIEQRKEWKTSGSGAAFMGTAAARIDPEELPARISGLALCGDELVYSAALEGVSSLYRRSFDPDDDCEGLIRSSNEMTFGGIDCKDGRLAVSMGANAASLHIGVMEISGAYDVYTDGDSIEEYPCWAENKNGIYFSTAGYARYDTGAIAALGPRSAAYLDLDRRSMTEILADERYDYLHPKERGGVLYCIRQPYGGEKPQSGITVKDVVMFPYRIIKGLFGFLNYFSTIFGGESLKSGGASANGTKAKNRSQKDMIIEGNIINAEKLDRINESRNGEISGIMPLSRVLIKKVPGGEEEVIAKGVLDYAPAVDGSVYISDGRQIYLLAPDGSRTRVAKASLAGNILAVPDKTVG